VQGAAKKWRLIRHQAMASPNLAHMPATRALLSPNSPYALPRERSARFQRSRGT
jgi:hypothetical protein